MRIIATVWVLGIIICLGNAMGSIDRVDPQSFEFNERLQYVVSYLGIRIGTIEVLNKYDPSYEAIEETFITLRTFSGIPFLSVHTEFYSKRGRDGYFIESTTFDRQRNKWAYYHASRPDGSSTIFIDRGYKALDAGYTYGVELDTLQPGYTVHDALTFLTILRDSVHTERPYEIDILIDRSIEQINIEPSLGVEILEVRAFNNETEAYHITGVIEFEAIHGLSRRYQAWLSTDDLRIPLKARVNIAIGSVKIELEEYERR